MFNRLVEPEYLEGLLIRAKFCISKIEFNSCSILPNTWRDCSLEQSFASEKLNITMLYAFCLETDPKMRQHF